MNFIPADQRHKKWISQTIKYLIKLGKYRLYSIETQIQETLVFSGLN
jgi:hypothetical protein